MSDGSAIEWTDATWSPTLGCKRVSEGCDGCYAIRTVHRMAHNPNPKISGAAASLTEWRDGRLDWTGSVTMLPHRLDLPLSWHKPRRIFVDSQSDLFHDDVSDGFIGSVWNTMALTPQHTYQILTKRPGRMRSLLKRWAADGWHWRDHEMRWCGPIVGPLPNVWLGVSVENQRWADVRIPLLLDTPAAVRFLSCEPLLGPVSLTRHLHVRPIGEDLAYAPLPPHAARACGLAPIDWVIAGGESGPNARMVSPGWVRSLLYQCRRAEIPFLFKQWGGRTAKANGRELDGRTWDEYPAVTS